MTQRDEPVLRADAIYLTDSGARCGTHAGYTARMTGRDISGQRVAEVGPEEVAYCEREGLPIPRCRICKREASRVVRVALIVQP